MDSRKRAKLPMFRAHPSSWTSCFEVESGISAQRVLRIARGDNQGQQAETQGLVETKPGEFRGHERVQGPRQHPTGQQVDTAAPEFPGAGAREHKPQQSRPLQDFVRHIEEPAPAGLRRRQRSACRLNPGRSPATAPAAPAAPDDFGLQQIDKNPIGQLMVQPR